MSSAVPRADAVLPPAARAVAVVGNYGNRNLGDEATLASLVRGIRRRRADVDIVVFSYDPLDTERRHHVEAVPAAPPANRAAPAVVRWWSTAQHLAGVFGVLRRVDLLIFGGGGLLDDSFRGPFHIPFLTAVLTTMARLAGAQVAFTCVGAGPIHSRLSAGFFRFAFARATRVSFRDVDSLRLSTRLRLTSRGSASRDLVFGLCDVGRPIRHPSSDIVINPIAYCDPRYWPTPDERRYRDYIRRIAELTTTLLARGRTVVFVPSQLRSDIEVIADIQHAIGPNRPPAGVMRVAPVLTVEDLFECLSSAEVVVACRFHGAVCAMAMGSPVLALSSHPKIDNLMRLCGQGEHVLSLDDCDGPAIVRAFDRIGEGVGTAAEGIARTLSRNAAVVHAEFDELFGEALPHAGRGAAPYVADTHPSNAIVNVRGR